MCQLLSHVLLFATLWTVAHQAPLSVGFSRQEYWSGLLFPSPVDIPDLGIELASPALADRFFTTKPSGKPHVCTFPGPEHICVDMHAHLHACTWLHCGLSALPSETHVAAFCGIFHPAHIQTCPTAHLTHTRTL